MKEIYISTDVETDGPIPGPHSMLSFGSAAYTADKLVAHIKANPDKLAASRAEGAKAYLAERGIAHLWTAGTAARDTAAANGPRARAFDTPAALIAALTEQPDAAQTLVKGSRFMKMERVVQALQALATVDGGAH